ncbi:DUF5906 domain-containing protein [Aliiglaciecola lipolytica]|uniref:DUF5906 domain-containing protein n=1 Tax=Aliiglaciecola lipolytica TaxID=477689 RepID=UPI001C0A54CC|nr:DUF5906 domain-containing protein [Aliiglaciecola lipolytica]MBU2877717.1 hypothetical protein [Aliiglaciecola lipolytica]
MKNLIDKSSFKNTVNVTEESPPLNPLTVTGESSILNPVYGINTVNGKSLTEDDLTKLRQLNKTYAHVVVGGKHKVASKIVCPTIGSTLSLESLADYKNRFLTEEKIAGLNQGEAWLKWKGKNYKPDGLNFYPSPELCPESVYNLYEGFAVAPKKGDIGIFLFHIQEVICSGDKKAYEFVLGWLAHLVQKPMEKPGVAIVLKSVEGTGKGTFFDLLKRILGTHASQVNGAYQLTGRFNSVVANQQLVFADEVDLTDPRTADKLKGLITEPRVCLERKGIDPVHMPSFTRFIFASNHDQVLKAGGRERRFLVLEPSSTYAQQENYFKPLWNWINEEGAAHFLHFLLKYDITEFDSRRAPITQALLEEKLHNLSPYQQFMLEELSKERPFDGAVRLSTKDMVSRCRIWLEDNGYQIAMPRIRSSIGKLIQRMRIDKHGKHGRDAMYELPSTSDMQNSFATLLGHEKSDIFD